MKILDVVRRSGRSLRQAKVRTLLTASAIAVGAFTLTLTLAASNGATAYVNRIITDNFNPAELIVTNDPTLLGQATSDKPQPYDSSFTSVGTVRGTTQQVKEITDSDIAKIKAVPGIASVRQSVSPTIQYVTRPGANGQIYPKYVASVEAYNSAQKPDVLAGMLSGELQTNQLVLPDSYVSVLGFTSNHDAIGKTVSLAVQKSFDTSAIASLLKQPLTASTIQSGLAASTEQVNFVITAVTQKPVVSQPGAPNLFISQAEALALNDYATQGTPNYHKYTFVYADVQDGTNASKLQAAQTKLKNMGYGVQSVKDTQQFLNQIIAVLRGIVVAFGLIAIVASIFGVVNTMYISVLQRTREIGLMKALGARNKDIGRLFRFEAALIGLVGGLLGSLLAVALGFALNPTIAKKLDFGNNNLLLFKPIQIIVLVLLLSLVAVLAGLLPARKAAHLDPIEALRTE